MAIRGVESQLPDREYIRALEAKILELEKSIAQLRLDQIANRR